MRVLVIDDLSLYREGIAAILARSERIDVVGTAASVGEGVAGVRQLKPDVVVLDTALPEGDGAIQALLESDPHTRVVALALSDQDDDRLAVRRSGASAYVSREASVVELVAAVEATASSSEPIRVLLLRLRRLTREIIRAILEGQPDIEVVREATGWPALVLLVDECRAQFVIVGTDQPELPIDCRHVLLERPYTRVLAAVDDGRQSLLYELQPRELPLGQLSPDRLLGAIRSVSPSA